MRLPAVAISAAFACGIALGLHPVAASNATSIFLLSSCFLASLVLILTGIALTGVRRLIPAAVLSLFTWVLLGFLGACVAEQPRPAAQTLAAEGFCLGIFSYVDHIRTDNCNFSLPTEMVQGKTGSECVGCGPRRFDLRCVAGREDPLD